MNKPSGALYTHDSTCCHYLGTKDQIDVWWCDNKGHPNLSSIIGRYGNKGPEYSSSHPPHAMADALGYLRHAQGWYHFALKRAQEENLYHEKGWKEIDKLYKKLHDDGLEREDFSSLGALTRHPLEYGFHQP